MQDPDNIESVIEYDPETNEYIVKQNIGDLEYRPSSRLSFEEYQNLQFEQSVRNYWKQKVEGHEGDISSSGLFPNLQFGNQALDNLLGNDVINITPQGAAELTFGIKINEVQDPKLSEKLRKTTTFDFQEDIKMNIRGSIGDKIRMGVTYDTKATFDFENQTKLEYVGKEDEIIKKIEAGNISMPLPGSLITGSQSLFGVKTEMQFGRLRVTSVFSQQKGETKTIEVKGGAQSQEFEVKADEYDANRHFFLSHYFKENYDRALENLPVINSGITITKIEVWVTNKTNNFENSRNILAAMDLAEDRNNIYASPDVIEPATIVGRFPDNDLNELYERLIGRSGIRSISDINSALLPWQAYGYNPGQDYEKIENARKLRTNEYTVNEQLGYISLNTALNADEVLAVAYEYTYQGRKFKVGEFSTDGITAPEVLIVKLLKGTTLTPQLPTWDLMMKNIYSIGAYQVNRENFILNIFYQDDKTGNAINYLPEGKLKDQILLDVMNLDNVNSAMDATPDGMFDFIPGITVLPNSGRIIFPVREPFGTHLKEKIDNDAIADKYIFQELYDSTLTKARQIAEKNKFKMMGEYRSDASSEISLNALNIPEGSVVVTAGGQKLQENIDYTVDYNLGRVNIINTGLLESGTPIRISLESNSLYSIQTKTLMGTHLDYRFSDDFNMGATILNLTERPLTQKVNIGDEPISNTIWGLNGSYRTESQLLTTLVDKLPFLDTKEKSSIMVDAEFAHLIPGHSKAIKEEGNAYIDDFEGSETSLDMKNISAWVLASVPQGQQDLFPEAARSNNVITGFNRAKLAWYKIDPLFLRNDATTPGHIKRDLDQQSNHFVREIFEKEIFPNKDYENNIPTALQVLNLAFYPDEKGPYNYEAAPEPGISAGVNEEGKLSAPETRWGGIMRQVPTSDFEAANVEYVEFWMMDPFVYNSGHSGGDFYINLGNVSEDILKDSQKSFEDGLPSSDVVEDVDTTAWGRVPVKQSLANAFDNDPEARQYQDVGLDGLGDEDERAFFETYLEQLESRLNAEAYARFVEDPSNDNYHYYRGSDYDAERLSILERYKKYNGLEGNSPTDAQSPEPYPTSGTSNPDIEDINRDNTLSETESYYQYKVHLEPGQMEIGQNYIVDKVKRNVKLANGEQSTIYWYQFKVPVRDPERVVGAIQDFKSIRFMRMFLKNFEDSVILRLAKLDLVRGSWRQYQYSMLEGQEGLSTPEFSDGAFEISSVNIEENSQKSPVNYVLPPDIDRVIDPSNPQLRQLNEQAIVLKVRDLDDGDARAAFKNVELDVRQYKKIKMFAHAEAIAGDILNDKELTAFVRLGTDYRDNYYEYEVPLVLTPEGNYDNNSTEQRRIVWPDENKFVIELDKLVDIKQMRNEEMRRAGSAVDYTTVFSMVVDGNRITVRGNPNLSNVRTIMIGVRNPSKENNQMAEDDGLAKSGEIWLNELRLSDFREEGGWAAKARISARLADFGTVTVAGNTSTPGFGSIEKKVNERSKEQVYAYDVSTNLNLGKFFPEKAKVSIPMYAGYSEGFINPQYNPLDPDVPLETALNSAGSEQERDSIKNIAQDYTRRKSLNFTNVKINKTNNEPKFYSPANFAVSYAYNEFYSRNINTEYQVQKSYRGGLSYVYNTRPKNIMPFRRAQGLNSKALRLIRDFNFYYQPSSFSFTTNLNRRYNAIKTRNINNPGIIIEPTFSKDFTWNRDYSLKYDLTKSLKLDFQATNIARIDEPVGMVNKNKDPNGYEVWKDSVWQNIREFGRNTQYNHILKANYRVPINKLPLLDWVNANAVYTATYNWDAGPQLKNDRDLGNTLRNSNTAQITSQLNFTSLYNKSGYLKRVNQQFGRGSRKTEYEDIQYEEPGLLLRSGRSKSIYHNLGTENIKNVELFDQAGNSVEVEWEVDTKRKISIETPNDLDDARLVVTAQVEKRANILKIIADGTLRLLMSARNVSLTYGQTEGTTLPGYTPSTQVMGMNTSIGWAPGLPFVMGWQDDNFAQEMILKGYMTTDTTLNMPYLMTYNQNLTARATLEPLPGIKIDLNANRTMSENRSEYYLPALYGSDPYNLLLSGNFSMTFIGVKTIFEAPSKDNDYYSEAFDKFKTNRQVISERLADQRVPNSDEGYDPNLQEGAYYDGYGPLSQEVLIPAFLSAYGLESENKVGLTSFPTFPLPNWRITYDGLKNLPFIKDFVKNISMSHAYRSNYSVGSFINHPDYNELGDGFSYVRDMQNNFIPENEINSVSLTEQFAPLINLDITLKNNLTARLEMKKSRNLMLSFANNQLSEMHTDEYSVSMGYRFDDFNLIFDFGGGQNNFKSDLNVRGSFTLRENLTILRKIAEDIDDVTAGQKAIVIGVSADYMLSNRFTVRLFYDQNINEPYVQLSYPTSNINFGFSFRFTLAQ